MHDSEEIRIWNQAIEAAAEMLYSKDLQNRVRSRRLPPRSEPPVYFARHGHQLYLRMGLAPDPEGRRLTWMG